MWQTLPPPWLNFYTEHRKARNAAVCQLNALLSVSRDLHFQRYKSAAYTTKLEKVLFSHPPCLLGACLVRNISLQCTPPSSKSSCLSGIMFSHILRPLQIFSCAVSQMLRSSSQILRSMQILTFSQEIHAAFQKARTAVVCQPVMELSRGLFCILQLPPSRPMHCFSLSAQIRIRILLLPTNPFQPPPPPSFFISFSLPHPSPLSLLLPSLYLISFPSSFFVVYLLLPLVWFHSLCFFLSLSPNQFITQKRSHTRTQSCTHKGMHTHAHVHMHRRIPTKPHSHVHTRTPEPSTNPAPFSPSTFSKH